MPITDKAWEASCKTSCRSRISFTLFQEENLRVGKRWLRRCLACLSSWSRSSKRYGRLYEIPHFLFFSRDHSQRGSRAYDYRKPHKAIAWFDPKMSGKLVFPEWRLFAEYLAAIHRSPLSWRDRLPCYSEIAKWLKDHRRNLARDLIVATEYLPAIGPQLAKAYSKCSESQWLKQVKQSVKELESILSKEEAFILVDENTLGNETFANWRTIPFLEREGQYWGLPADDSTAIQELERLRQLGANSIVFA